MAGTTRWGPIWIRQEKNKAPNDRAVASCSRRARLLRSLGVVMKHMAAVLSLPLGHVHGYICFAK
jgi:hypothetical protein